MSVQYCHECDKHIDTDYDAEHFDAHKITIKQIWALHALAREKWNEKLNAIHLSYLNEHFGTDYADYGKISRQEASRWIAQLQEEQRTIQKPEGVNEHE